jgi:hypothetical protein
VPSIGLISKVPAVTGSTAQPSLNAARHSSARTRRGPQVPGCRSLKPGGHVMPSQKILETLHNVEIKHA